MDNGKLKTFHFFFLLYKKRSKVDRVCKQKEKENIIVHERRNFMMNKYESKQICICITNEFSRPNIFFLL